MAPGVPPLLKSFLQEQLGIHLIRRKMVKAKRHILMPRKDSRKVSLQRQDPPSPGGVEPILMPADQPDSRAAPSHNIWDPSVRFVAAVLSSPSLALLHTDIPRRDKTASQRPKSQSREEPGRALSLTP